MELLHRVEEHHNLLFHTVEEHVDDVVYQENRLCLIIFGHNVTGWRNMCWKILKLSELMFSHGGGTPQFVISHGGGTH